MRIRCLFAALALIPVMGFGPGALASDSSILEKLFILKEALVEVQSTGARLVTPGRQTYFDADTRRFVTVKQIRPILRKSRGLGILIDSGGILVTNAHILQKRSVITIRLHNNESVTGQVIKIIPESDLAYIGIQTKAPLTTVDLADSDETALHDTVYTIGGSEVSQDTISQGEVTGIVHPKDAGPEASAVTILQVSFNIYQGDSGSPLFNADGELLGIMTAALVKTGRTAYAIPSSTLKKHYLGLRKPSANGGS